MTQGDKVPPTGISVIAEFTKEQLEAEDKRKASFEQRGLAVITTSGALVTLLFGLAALSTRAQQTFVLEEDAKPPLAIALGLFVLAAIAALFTNMPAKYEWPDLDNVAADVNKTPPPTEEESLKNAALTRISVLKAARAKNEKKGKRLVVAMGSEVLAVAAVAVAILIVIL